MNGMIPIKQKLQLKSSQIMALSFIALILFGGFLLTLPISSAGHNWTPFIDALFTSATSVCVTGLVIYDTATYWSFFGQTVILILIQIGGLGIVTVTAAFALLSGKKISFFQRTRLQEAVSAHKVGGIVRLTFFILKTTLLIELMAAFCMAPVFVKCFGVYRGAWVSFFTAISAFCNAGLDLMGSKEAFSSLTSFVGNPIINIVVMFLIIIGGLGFLTWDDIKTHRFKLKNYMMQSKVILATSGLLIAIPAIYFFFVELFQFSLHERIFGAIFQAVTPRTAGFNTVDLNTMTDSGRLMIMFLMLIGGSPGSTAGGIKTTSFVALIGCAYAVFTKHESVHFFGRRISSEVISYAVTLAVVYLFLPFIVAMFISLHDSLPLTSCLFETVSAIATVGLSLGITSSLSLLSKIVIITLMYIGRLGGLTIIYAMFSNTKQEHGKYPLDSFSVG